MTDVLPFQCGICGAEFDPPDGGVCSHCGRPCCPLHVIGGVGQEPICSECQLGEVTGEDVNEKPNA